MNDDLIDSLNERDDVEKTEYSYVHSEDGRKDVELWHNTEGLQTIFEKAMDGCLSPRALREFAKEQALVVREAHMENVPVKSLYPDITERLKEEVDHDTDYEYKVTRGE